MDDVNLRKMSPGIRGQYIAWKIKTDPTFREHYFYSEDEDYDTITHLWKRITAIFLKSYGESLSRHEFGTVMLTHLYGKQHDWHPLDTYGGEYGIESWMFRVSIRAVSKYLQENGAANTTVRQFTVSTTELTLQKNDPVSCSVFIDEVMPEGMNRDLLNDIYVECKPDTEILATYHWDDSQYHDARKKAEDQFKAYVLNNEYPFEDMVIADKKHRPILYSDDFTTKSEGMYDNSFDDPFHDVFGVHLTNAEVKQITPAFMSGFVKRLKWTETDTYIFLQRSMGVPPQELADEIGRKRSYIDNRFSVLNKRFSVAFKAWWKTHT